MRTDYCGLIDTRYLDQMVTIKGWVHRRRDHGGVIFIDLRDREGLVQVVIDPDTPEAFSTADSCRNEFVLAITGLVRRRPEGTTNSNLVSGEIEILAKQIEILNSATTPPFQIDEENLSENVRLTNRVIDLRRPAMQRNLRLRYRVAMGVRNYLDKQGFIDVETPMLTRSTPEGARDYLVPSRVHPGEFFALPQSPQLFKQLLMVAGFDRYYQITKCFRDEDLRADRQPEFTQIDCEMAFVEQEDVLEIFEGMTAHLLKDITGKEFGKFPRMTFDEAMRTYGNDKPDIRFGMKFVEVDDLVKGKDFKIFDEAELVVGINVEGCADYTRKQIDELIDWVKRPQIGASGMVWIKFQNDGVVTSSVNKFYSEEDLQRVAAAFNAKQGDLIFLMSGNANKVRTQLSALRMELGNRLGLRKGDEFAPLWVVDFPLLEWDEETGRYHAMHHPFTSPKPEDVHLLETEPGKARANAYDMVLNGNEIGGGSVRIFNKELQSKMFDRLDLS